MAEEKKGNSTSRRNIIIIGVIAIIAIVNGVKWYLESEEREELQVYYTNELSAAQTRFEEISLELDEKISEIEKLGGNIEELTNAKREVEKERDQLQRTRTANSRLIAELRDKTEGYAELLRAKDEEIINLRALNTELLSENTTLKTEKNELSKSISDLNQNKEQLEEKVALASRLEARNIAIFAIASGGREREGSFRKRQIQNLKIEFNITKNDVAPIEGKEILLRVIDSNNQVYFDVARGAGTFIIDGKEQFYTLKQDILFDNTSQKVTFLYEKGSEYNEGDHTVEIYTDGYLMGKKSFTVK